MPRNPLINWARLGKWCKAASVDCRVEYEPEEIIFLGLGDGPEAEDIIELGVGTTPGAASVLQVYLRGMIDGMTRLGKFANIPEGQIGQMVKVPLATMREIGAMTSERVPDPRVDGKII